MIFVIFGTEAYPFDRLAREIDLLKETGVVKDEVYMQLGSCAYRPSHCMWDEYLMFDEMCKKIESADTVVAHAGAGTALLCLQLGKRPILVPRRKQFGEHVDDHQVTFARSMEKVKHIRVAHDVKELRECLNKPDGKEVATEQSENQQEKLIAYLESL